MADENTLSAAELREVGTEMARALEWAPTYEAFIHACADEIESLRSRLAAAEADLAEERALHGETAHDLDDSEASLARVTQLCDEVDASAHRDEFGRFAACWLKTDDVRAALTTPAAELQANAKSDLDLKLAPADPTDPAEHPDAPVGALLVPDDTCRCRYVNNRPVYLCEYHHD